MSAQDWHYDHECPRSQEFSLYRVWAVRREVRELHREAVALQAQVQIWRTHLRWEEDWHAYHKKFYEDARRAEYHAAAILIPSTHARFAPTRAAMRACYAWSKMSAIYGRWNARKP